MALYIVCGEQRACPWNLLHVKAYKGGMFARISTRPVVTHA